MALGMVWSRRNVMPDLLGSSMFLHFTLSSLFHFGATDLD